MWDAVAKKLNSILKDQGIPSYRTGTQCKERIKYLQDEYKRVEENIASITTSLLSFLKVARICNLNLPSY